MKQTILVNFTNILRAAFLLISFRQKNTHKLCQVFFELLGSASAKAAHRILLKLTPGLNFINISLKAFTLVGPKIAKQHW